MLISNSVSVSTRNFFTLIYEANVLRTLVFPALVATIALARIHRRTPMDGVRAAEGGG